jgi:hypothetical protein
MAQACARAYEKLDERWRDAAARSPGKPLAGVLASYLSTSHRDRPAEGCVAAALGAEAAREGPALRHAVTQGTKTQLDALSGLMIGASKSARRQRAAATLAGMVGALVLSVCSTTKHCRRRSCAPSGRRRRRSERSGIAASSVCNGFLIRKTDREAQPLHSEVADAEAFEGLERGLEVRARRAERPSAGSDEADNIVERSGAEVSLMVPIGNEGERRDGDPA